SRIPLYAFGIRHQWRSRRDSIDIHKTDDTVCCRFPFSHKLEADRQYIALFTGFPVIAATDQRESDKYIYQHPHDHCSAIFTDFPSTSMTSPGRTFNRFRKSTLPLYRTSPSNTTACASAPLFTQFTAFNS